MLGMTPPDEWPLDREPEDVEEKLAPFDDHADWQEKMGTEQQERLGMDGRKLMMRLGTIQSFLKDSDMTPEEAIECLEHEIEDYRNG